METLTLREFQRKFTKINAHPCNVTRNGVLIGVWLPTGHKAEQQKPVAKLINFENVPEGVKINMQPIPEVAPVCSICKKPASFSGIVYEGGEEIASFLCQSHYNTWSFKKNFQKINNA